MGGFSIWHWVVVFLIASLVFGTKRLKDIGNDIGEAIKSFKKAITEDKPDNKI